ncbi:MAG: enoyl-CoA hydratase/isomerase family protein [Candidatus Rokubacteria bacterium]|nr:enoyl-CoA hydratase/isomerase family protein [Candidatus Rokubacteria bacterium]
MADEVLCTVDDGVATITLNRPDKRNAINTPLLEGLRGCFNDLEERRDVRVVVVRGAGRAFCSGMDLNELSRKQSAEVDPETGVTAMLQRIEQSRHPTIAMVHGAAFAGGCELALHCDLRLAADIARFAMPLARLGLIVPFPLGRKIVEVVGPAYAREILLTGRPVDARRAYEIGMVHQVVPAHELEAATYALARSMAGNALLSLAGIKATILRATSLREKIEHADLDAMTTRARKSADALEGVRAMLEKRTPVFRGE